ALTGITGAMVANAPIFEELAGEIADTLAGHIIVAHNARYDYAALRNAYGRMNADFHAPVLCTAKLSRQLFRREKQHSLDAVVSRHALTPGRDASARNRALGDARLVQQFWEKLQRVFSQADLEKAVRKLAALPILPVVPA